MRMTDNEQRDAIKLIQQGKALPDKYRFLLFDEGREVELVWNGKTNVIENSSLPFQTIEHIDEPRSEQKIESQKSLFDTSGRQISGWTNKLIWGDNKLILSSLKNGSLRKEIEAQGGLKLIYIDPPFDVGADFSMDVEIGDDKFTKQPSVIEQIAYRDTWGNGADSFIAMIYERMVLMRDLLADDGSIYIHCDYRVTAFIKLVLDEVFGNDNFRNEIIWCYQGTGKSLKQYKRKHDTIWFYGKSQTCIFNAKEIGVPFGEKQIKKFSGKDEKGSYKEYKHSDGKIYRKYLEDDDYLAVNDWWSDIFVIQDHDQRVGYPTQKPETLLERIVKASSNEGDLIADFFCGSGTTMAVAEKLGRKWIGSDLGRFGVHTSRKRLIGVQRQLKAEGKDYRAFEILNIGRYDRVAFENRKEDEFVQLILLAYKAEKVESFNNFVGKKQDRLIAIGSLSTPVTSSFIESILDECLEKNITKADVLGFDYEMGVNFDEAKRKGIDLRFRIIPNEVFDKKAVERGHVYFYDVAYLEAKPIVKKDGSKRTLSIELTDFGVFYNQDDLASLEEQFLKSKQKSQIMLQGGQIIKLTKSEKDGIVTPETLTKHWTDWIDYWSVDFDFTDKFENEWQSFRTKKNRAIELVSAAKEVMSGKRTVAIKVVDIFGHDTTKIIEVNV